MDFVNRLKPEHLQSFWYFSSKVNFALVGTFGSLLWATSPSIQEADFYKARLSEYRWTLRVSSRGADFMEFAVGVLDASAGYLQQEQWKKRGPLVGTIQGYQNTVGNTEHFGLGMGVGSSGMDLSQPPPQPPPGWSNTGTMEVVQHAPGQLSPVTIGDGSEGGDTNEGLDEEDVDEEGDDSEEDYDEMMDEEGYSDDHSAGAGRGRGAARYHRAAEETTKGFAAYQAAAATATTTVSSASTPSSTPGSSGGGMDFLMIPNTGFGSGE